MPEPDIKERWDEIERLLRADYDDEEQGMAGNSKPQNPWVHTLVISLVAATVAGIITGVANRFGSDSSAESKQLTIVTTKLEYVSEQVRLLASRPYITRDEFEREFSRLERRVGEVERELKPRGGS